MPRGTSHARTGQATRLPQSTTRTRPLGGLARTCFPFFSPFPPVIRPPVFNSSFFSFWGDFERQRRGSCSLSHLDAHHSIQLGPLSVHYQAKPINILVITLACWSTPLRLRLSNAFFLSLAATATAHHVPHRAQQTRLLRKVSEGAEAAALACTFTHHSPLPRLVGS